MFLRAQLALTLFCLAPMAHADLTDLAALSRISGATPAYLMTGYLMFAPATKQKARAANYCRQNPTHKHCCFSAVKYALLDMGLVENYLPGEHAKSAAKMLAKEGWTEKSCDAQAEPTVGMVCTFSGFTRGSGHAEIWKPCPGTGKMGWYYGFSCKPQATRRGCFSCKVPPAVLVARLSNFESLPTR